MATYTGVWNGALTGSLLAGGNTPYSTVHNQSSADTLEHSNVQAQNAFFGGLYYIRRLYINYQTNVGASSTVSTAVVHIRGSSKIDVDSDYIVLVSFSPSNLSVPAIGDYSNFGTTELSNRITIANFNASGDNAFTLNSTAINLLNLSGNTFFGFRTGNDLGTVTPTGNGQIVVDTSQGNTPTIVITYTAGTPSASNFFAIFK